jgi:hypothetical protein
MIGPTHELSKQTPKQYHTEHQGPEAETEADGKNNQIYHQNTRKSEHWRDDVTHNGSSSSPLVLFPVHIYP